MHLLCPKNMKAFVNSSLKEWAKLLKNLLIQQLKMYKARDSNWRTKNSQKLQAANGVYQSLRRANPICIPPWVVIGWHDRDSDSAQKLDFEDIIYDFASAKAWKNQFWFGYWFFICFIQCILFFILNFNMKVKLLC